MSHNPIPMPMPAPTPSWRRAGSLTYSVGALAMLLLWVAIGHLGITLLGSSSPPARLLDPKGLAAPDADIRTTMDRLLRFVGLAAGLAVLVMAIASDHTRTRWGRRRPYLLVTTIAAGACALAAAVVRPSALAENSTLLIAVLAALLALAVLMSNALYLSYVCQMADTVPPRVLATFWALQALPATAAGIVISYFQLHPTENAMLYVPLICIGAACLLVFCWRAPEGEYPSPAEGGVAGALSMFARQCVVNPLYICFYLCIVFTALAGSLSMMRIFFYRHSLGLGLQEIGTVMALTALITTPLVLVSAVLADIIHPIRLMLLAAFLGIAAAFGMCFVSGKASFVVVSILGSIAGAMVQASDVPLMLRLPGRSHVGQFFAVNSLLRHAAFVFGMPCALLFLGLMQERYGRDHYTSIFVWEGCFRSLAAVALLATFLLWRRRLQADAWQ